jgi:hypothetical protein
MERDTRKARQNGGCMTELMKRYEAETDECATWIWHEREFLTDDYIAWLESQLRWRPVSKKPKEGQIVFVVIQTGWVVAQYLHGEFYVDDGFNFGDMIGGVTSWLPIPPAPQG